MVSSVTHRTRRTFGDMIFLHQLPPKRQLVFRWLPVHTEHKGTRPDEAFRFAVALKTPLHEQRLLPPHHRHLVDPPMARHTANAFLYMDAVIEVDKIREVMDSDPGERCVGAQAGAHRFEHRALSPDLGVAVHTGLGGRNASHGGFLHRGVAVTAVDADTADVMLMAEGDWLSPHNASFGHVG